MLKGGIKKGRKAGNEEHKKLYTAMAEYYKWLLEKPRERIKPMEADQLQYHHNNIFQFNPDDSKLYYNSNIIMTLKGRDAFMQSLIWHEGTHYAWKMDAVNKAKYDNDPEKFGYYTGFCFYKQITNWDDYKGMTQSDISRLGIPWQEAKVIQFINITRIYFNDNDINTIWEKWNKFH